MKKSSKNSKISLGAMETQMLVRWAFRSNSNPAPHFILRAADWLSSMLLLSHYGPVVFPGGYLQDPIFHASPGVPMSIKSLMLLLLLSLIVAACDDSDSKTLTPKSSPAMLSKMATQALRMPPTKAPTARKKPLQTSSLNALAAAACEDKVFIACVNGAEAQPEDCSLLGEGAYCSAEGCVASCTEGSTVCQGGATGHPFVCTNGNLVSADTCEANEYCAEGECLTDLCEAGSTFCQDNHPFLCDDAGSASSQIGTCTSDELCQNGQCISQNPTAGPCAQISQAIQDQTGTTLTVSPGEAGYVIYNGNTSTLRSVVSEATEGSTILLEDGTYTFQEASDGGYTGIYITTPNITIRSASGNPEAVILDSNYFSHGNGSAPITIAAADVTIADITVKRSIYHLIHLWNGADRVLLHNLRLIDGGEQFVKTSPGDSNRITGGQVSCSRFVMSAEGRNNVWGYGAADGWARCYTGGIDTHETDQWVVNDNHFEGIYCDDTIPHPAHGKERDNVEHATYVGGLAEHAIHMWDGNDHILERNVIVNCARGIGLGLGEGPRVDGGIVRNNMIVSEHAGSSEHDVGIMLEGAANVQLFNNSVIFTHDQAYPNAIEYRFGTTQGVTISNNLTNKLIRQRDGAQANLSNNYTEAQSSWFVDPSVGDLHLVDCAQTEINDQGLALTEVQVDIDNEARAAQPDIGADECIAE